MTAKSLGVGLLGLGTVGSAVARAFADRQKRVDAAAGRPVRLLGAAVRDPKKARDAGDAPVTGDPFAILDDPEIGLVIEVIGGHQPAFDLQLAALERGKHLVTANKEAVAKEWNALHEAARLAKRELRFEAAVGGSVPVIRGVMDLGAVRPRVLRGLVNGTTTYICSRLENGIAFGDPRRCDRDRGGNALSKPLVFKFGGTSVGSPAAIEAVAKIVAAEKGERIVVVSATSGTTDALVKAAEQAAAGDAAAAQKAIERLAEQHKNLAADLLGVQGAEALTEIGELTERTIALLRSVALLRECSPRSSDAILSYGERVSAPIVAATLTARGVPSEALSAEGLLITDDAFGHANPILELTRERVETQLLPRMRYGTVPVVTGFVASTADGVTTTLGRGRSDYSAAVLAAALGARECRIFTDVSGVMSADPRIVPDAQPLPELSYAEAAELSYFGAKVIHPRTVR